MRVRWIRMVAGVLLLFLAAGALSACGARQPGTGQPEAPAAPGTPPGGAETPAFGLGWDKAALQDIRRLLAE